MADLPLPPPIESPVVPPVGQPRLPFVSAQGVRAFAVPLYAGDHPSSLMLRTPEGDYVMPGVGGLIRYKVVGDRLEPDQCYDWPWHSGQASVGGRTMAVETETHPYESSLDVDLKDGQVPAEPFKAWEDGAHAEIDRRGGAVGPITYHEPEVPTPEQRRFKISCRTKHKEP